MLSFVTFVLASNIIGFTLRLIDEHLLNFGLHKHFVSEKDLFYFHITLNSAVQQNFNHGCEVHCGKLLCKYTQNPLRGFQY